MTKFRGGLFGRVQTLGSPIASVTLICFVVSSLAPSLAWAQTAPPSGSVVSSARQDTAPVAEPAHELAAALKDAAHGQGTHSSDATSLQASSKSNLSAAVQASPGQLSSSAPPADPANPDPGDSHTL